MITMPKYIERDALEVALNHRLNFLMAENGEYDHYTSGFDEAVTRVETFPAADVAPERHGRWIEPTRLYYGAKQYERSLCYSDKFWKKHSITEKYPHCPNCGATMELED